MGLLDQEDRPAPAHGHNAHPEGLLGILVALELQRPTQPVGQELPPDARQAEEGAVLWVELVLVKAALDVPGAYVDHLVPAALERRQRLAGGQLGVVRGGKVAVALPGVKD